YFRQPDTHCVRVRMHGFMRSEEQEIARLCLPGFDIREYGAHGAIEDLHRAIIDVIGLHPLEKHSAGLQTPVDRLVILAREQPGYTCSIRVGRLGDDDVVLFACREQRFTCVTNGYVQFWVMQRIAIYRSAV